jgi:hypoxanthine phosphoribosyltransferase
VLIVDETCDSGDTMRLAVAAIAAAGASEIKTAVAFQTGEYTPDFHAIATESTIILPWDREVLVNGELRPNPLYADVFGLTS